MKIISIINNKGGVGKTTTTIHLGAYLASKGFSILMIDFDPQCNLSSLMRAEKISYDIIDFLGKKPNLRLKQVDSNLFVLKGSQKLNTLENNSNGISFKNINFKELLQIFNGKIDYVLIDCQPKTLDGSLNANEVALNTSDYFIAPIHADYSSYKGIGMLLKAVQLLKIKGATVKLLGVLFCDINPQETLYKEIRSKIESLTNDALFNVAIRRTVNIKKAEFIGKTIFQYNKNCTGSWDYKSFGEEFLTKILK